jgi:uncharacterized protein YgbK (DUF1537 family)
MRNDGLRMIIVADDITGAAEIAGIAFSQGQQVRLVCGGEEGDCGTATEGTTVIATDTRSMTEADAITETKRIAKLHKRDGSFCVIPCVIFKKTDSALRGHVVAELTALMEATGYQRAVYLPANPSKGRIIKNGTYYINNTPIHETDFSFDPEFPAKTSSLRERFPDAEAKGIIMPDAENMDDIRQVVSTYNDGKTLFAGAADLFSALLPPSSLNPHPSSFNPKSPNNTLILCGSTQSKPLELGIPIAPMPREVYDGSNNLDLWDTSPYSERHSLILTMPYTHRTGKEAAIHLRTMMALKAKELITKQCPDHLIIEGGATAWATLQALGWNLFNIERQIAPGVVQMSATNGTLVTLKPGSYSWGNLFAASANG